MVFLVKLCFLLSHNYMHNQNKLNKCYITKVRKGNSNSFYKIDKKTILGSAKSYKVPSQSLNLIKESIFILIKYNYKMV